jgi:hypothetical protein
MDGIDMRSDSRNGSAGQLAAPKTLDELRGIVRDVLESSLGDEQLVQALVKRANGMPAFVFQEGDDAGVGSIYAEIARLTGGAVARFDSGSAARLSDLLRAVAAFAVGGAKALAAQQTEAAKLLLTQVKR